MKIALIAFCLLMPFLALGLAKRFAWARVLGPVLLCCGFGILVANQPLVEMTIPRAAIVASVSKLLSSVAIVVAIPLLLFQSDLSKLREHGKTAILSFVLSVVSVFVGVLAVTLWMGPLLESPGIVSGMVMSVYIGGTPNLVAVQSALKVNKETFGLVYASTTFVSTFYLLFMLTVAKPLLQRFFPKHPSPEPMAMMGEEKQDDDEPKVSWRVRAKHIALSLVASIACVALSAGLTFAVTGETKGEAFSLGIILSITTLSVVGSFWKRLRSIPTHESVGMLFILIFCVSAGMMMDVSKLMATGGSVLTLTAWSVALLLPLHFILHRLFRIDLDTTIAMSTATMFGPPFIPAVVQALDNRSVLLPCMTMGFLGYAVGTYLGIAVGYYL